MKFFLSVINVKYFFIVFFILILSVPQSFSQSRPNILLVVTDDQGYWDVGVHGNEIIETPNLDNFSEEGANFSHFYAGPVCAPTRAGLMTGRYHLRTGLYNTRFGGDHMDREEITIAELLKVSGYRTGLIGKWHLGKYHGYQPNQKGFDEFFGHYYGHIEKYDYPDQLVYNGKEVPARKYVTDLFTDATVSFIESSSDEQPFFAYLAYNAPHSPFVAGTSHGRQERGDRLIAKYMRQGLTIRDSRIYAMIEIIDENFGRLMDYLEKSGLSENTIVIFAGDNGGVSRHYSAGLRGRKGSVFEGGVRTPFMIRWPEKIKPDTKIDAMVSHVDLLPTISEIVNINLPTDRKIDGKSILPLMLGDESKSPHQYIYHHWDRYFPNPHNIWAITDGRYKLLRNLTPWQDTPDVQDEPAGELYDLKQDPQEKHNIADQNPEKINELRNEFLRWFDEVTEGQEYKPIPIPVGNPEEDPVEIQASWANIKGPTVNYTFLGYDWDTIDEWKTSDDKAIWNLDVKQSGTYQVFISYACVATNLGGSVSISTNDQNILEFIPEKATPSQDVFIKQNIGKINLSNGKRQLTVKVNKTTGREVMKLNKIWLEKVN